MVLTIELCSCIVIVSLAQSCKAISSQGPKTSSRDSMRYPESTGRGRERGIKVRIIVKFLESTRKNAIFIAYFFLCRYNIELPLSFGLEREIYFSSIEKTSYITVIIIYNYIETVISLEKCIFPSAGPIYMSIVGGKRSIICS